MAETVARENKAERTASTQKPKKVVTDLEVQYVSSNSYLPR